MDQHNYSSSNQNNIQYVVTASTSDAYQLHHQQSTPKIYNVHSSVTSNEVIIPNVNPNEDDFITISPTVITGDASSKSNTTMMNTDNQNASTHNNVEEHFDENFEEIDQDESASEESLSELSESGLIQCVESNRTIRNLWGPVETQCLNDLIEKYNKITDDKLTNAGKVMRFCTKREIYSRMSNDLYKLTNVRKTRDQIENRCKSLIRSGELKKSTFLSFCNKKSNKNNNNQELPGTDEPINNLLQNAIASIQNDSMDIDKNEIEQSSTFIYGQHKVESKEEIQYHSDNSHFADIIEHDVDYDNEPVKQSNTVLGMEITPKICRNNVTIWTSEQSDFMLRLKSKYLTLYRTKKEMWDRIAVEINQEFDLQRTGENCANRLKTLIRRKKPKFEDLPPMFEYDGNDGNDCEDVDEDDSDGDDDGHGGGDDDVDGHDNRRNRNNYENTKSVHRPNNPNNFKSSIIIGNKSSSSTAMTNHENIINGSVVLRDTLLEICKVQEENRERRHREMLSVWRELLTNKFNK